MVTAANIVARDNVPAFANSAYDGYAVQASNLYGASTATPITLDVVDEIQAGHTGSVQIKSGQAARIMTGAHVPDGADAIVPFESTDRVDWGRLDTSRPHTADNEPTIVSVLETIKPGENIRPSGGDVRAGNIVLEAGRTLGAPEIGVLASVGISSVLVYPRAVVALLPTGNEIVELDTPLKFGQVRNSNAWALEAAATSIGANPRRLPIAGDSVEELRSGLANTADAHIIVTIGGVSMGDFDLVKNVLGTDGQIDFWQINMRPGKPLVFGQLNNIPLIGLPGNPVSSMVCFALFVRPALLRLMGHTDVTHPRIRSCAGERLESSSGKRTFIRVKLNHEHGNLVCRSVGDQDSYRMSSLVAGHGLAVIPEDATVEVGESVDVMVLDEQAVLRL